MPSPKSLPSKELKKARVLIVDDHPMMRQGIAQQLSLEPDLVVCGEAGSVAEALRAVRMFKPDLVLADISLPGETGLELVRTLSQLDPNLPTLVLSVHEESLYAEQALRAGARGYLNKQESGEKLLLAIRSVIDGKVFVSEKTTARLLNSFSARLARPEHAPYANLSEREFEILHWIGEGLSTKQIATRLEISTKTVEAHRVNIKRKLGLETSGELSVYAARMWAASGSDLGAGNKPEASGEAGGLRRPTS